MDSTRDKSWKWVLWRFPGFCLSSDGDVNELVMCVIAICRLYCGLLDDAKRGTCVWCDWKWSRRYVVFSTFLALMRWLCHVKTNGKDCPVEGSWDERFSVSEMCCMAWISRSALFKRRFFDDSYICVEDCVKTRYVKLLTYFNFCKAGVVCTSMCWWRQQPFVNWRRCYHLCPRKLSYAWVSIYPFHCWSPFDSTDNERVFHKKRAVRSIDDT